LGLLLHGIDVGKKKKNGGSKEYKNSELTKTYALVMRDGWRGNWNCLRGATLKMLEQRR